MNRDPEERGFVLVGVIMFVLALTIIGLSLYSLSSYEAQFMRRSHDSNSALYRAQGGLEIVKAILSESGRLPDARNAEGFEGIVWANAWKANVDGTHDSLNTFANGDLIHIDVIDDQGTTFRHVHSRYIAQTRQDYYKRLFTVAGSGSSISVSDFSFGDGLLHGSTVDLTGGVWQLGDTAWAHTPPLDSWSGGPVKRDSALAVPDVGGFMAAHMATAIPVTVDNSNPAQPHLDLLGPPNAVRFYRLASNFGNIYTLHDSLSTNGFQINVSGLAVLLLPNGARFEKEFVLGGTSSDALVMVGRANGGDHFDPNAALWFFGEIQAPNVPLILTSDANVLIECIFHGTTDMAANHLSVLSNTLLLTGPVTTSGKHATFTHPASMDAIIDQLYSANALPQPSVAQTQSFQFVAGSWRELNP